MSEFNNIAAIDELNELARTVPSVVPEVAADIDPMSTPLWELDNRILDPYAEFPPSLTWGQIGGRPAIERQGIITVSAKPKQGKSMSVYALLVSIVGGCPIDTFTPYQEQRPRLVMVFDTEMNEPTLQRRLRNVYKMLGEQSQRFMVVPLLGVKKSERAAVIQELTDRFNPDIVAIDIVTKLVNDFNSPEECSDFGDWLEKYAQTRTVICIIHQNKSKEDTNMKGHLGSVLAESAVENFSATRKDNVFTLVPVSARNSNVDDAPGVSFTLSDEGTFAGAAQVLERQREIDAEKWRNDLRLVFGDDEKLSHTELKTRISQRQGITVSYAEDKIRNARECGAIRKADESRTAPYMLT